MNEPHYYPEINRPYQHINHLNNNNPRPQSRNINIPNYSGQNNSNMEQRSYYFGPFSMNISNSGSNQIPYTLPRQSVPRRYNNLSLQYQEQILPVIDSNNNNRTVNRQSYNSEARLYKMDGIFAYSLKSLKNYHQVQTIIVFLLLLGVILLYKFDFLHKGMYGYSHGVIYYDGQLKQSVIPFLILAEFTIILLKLMIFFKIYHKVDFALYAANLIGHGVLTYRADLTRSFEENTSDVYLLIASEVTYYQGMENRIKTLHKDITMNQIRVCIKNSACCSTQLHELIEFGMFVCAIYLIIVLAQDQTTWMEKVLLISTIVYWFLQNYKLIIYTIVLLLCPLIVIGVIVVACFTANSSRRQFTVPEPINPTNEQIINCGGTCSICMMYFTPLNSVIVLPCSDKHMFHYLCINGWLRLKTTCPNCRFDLAA